jgi:hypothetical protein
MRAENQIGINEWLLGSTILCRSCGCLWLVPGAENNESYLCRQCGNEVTVVRKAAAKDQSSDKRSPNS